MNFPNISTLVGKILKYHYHANNPLIFSFWFSQHNPWEKEKSKSYNMQL
jgi:hypothetical protein